MNSDLMRRQFISEGKGEKDRVCLWVSDRVCLFTCSAADTALQ